MYYLKLLYFTQPSTFPHKTDLFSLKAVQHAEFIALQEILANGIYKPEDVV